MKINNKNILICSIASVVIFCLIVIIVFNSGYYYVGRLIDPNNDGLINDNMITKEETVAKIVRLYIQEHHPDICEDGEYIGEMDIIENEKSWIVSTFERHGSNANIEISKKNGKVIEMIITKGRYSPNIYIRNFIRNKDMAIGIAQAIFDENHLELFELEDPKFYLHAEEIKGYWVVYTYTDQLLFGSSLIIQISAKTGEVIRMFYG